MLAKSTTDDYYWGMMNIKVMQVEENTNKFGVNKIKVSMLMFISFNSHILGDLLGSGHGWGVPYFWPLNKTIYEFSSPFQWELDSWQNLLVTAFCFVVIIIIGVRRKRTIIEIFSIKTDNKVVAIFNRWFRSEG